MRGVPLIALGEIAARHTLVDAVQMRLKSKDGKMAVQHKFMELTAKMKVPLLPDALRSRPCPPLSLPRPPDVVPHSR